MKRLSQNAFSILASAALMLLSVGCSRNVNSNTNSNRVTNSNGPSNSSQEPEAKFAITEPASGSEVDRNAITVKGVGAKPGYSIKVEVLTNEWYLQDGKYDIRADGTWAFSPCHLKGRGSLKFHHTIKASLMRGNEVIAFDTVDEIKAPEPVQ